jgi:hypothetical protein
VINRNFPDLSLAMQRAEMLFDAGTSNVCQTAMETLRRPSTIIATFSRGCGV